MSDMESRFWPGFDQAFKSGRYLGPKIDVRPHSVASIMLNLFKGEHLLAKGTGWFWRLGDDVAVVTAWHNFSGLHHTLRKPLSKTAAMPDRLRFRYMSKHPQSFQDADVPLYLDEALTKPRWFVHPDCGSFFDMAFIIIGIEGGDVHCINDLGPSSGPQPSPGSDLFAIGFPQGVGMFQLFAVWKRASVATDPGLLTEGHPKFLIDVAGRGGLSGAPVFKLHRQHFINPAFADSGAFMQFIGLYSGRAADQLQSHARSAESSDLGFVWRSEVVMEMLAGGVIDEQPEVGKGKVEMGEIWHQAAAAEVR